MSEPKEHCDHECVCDNFHPEYDPDYIEVCNNKDCEHDTRSRPHPAPTTTHTGCGFKEYHHCDGEYDELKTVIVMLEAEVTRLTGIEQQAARKAREDVREVLSHSHDEDCVGEMNSKECLSYECGCTLCKFDYAIKSLRGGDP